MKRILLAILLSCLLAQPVQAQDGYKLFFPIVTKSGGCELMTDPILRVTDGTTVIDLIGPGSGWELADPYWQPQIAQFKGGGAFVDSGLAEGKQLVHREYDNVIETIPLSVTGIDQGAAIQTIRDLLQLGRQASDYYTESYEYDDGWLEAKPACANSLTGYSRIIKMSIPNLSNIFGQPFFSAFEHAVMEDITLVIEREPFWRGTPPGEIVGPLYNLIKNPDFELWNFGTGDSQPDSWTDLESLWITGQNGRDNNPRWGNYDLKIKVSGSTKAGAVKGVTQIIDNITGGLTYTAVALVRNGGVSNGVGRILITYSNQLELYRSSTQHGWTLYVDTFTPNTNDIVSINCEILTTSANTDGTVYFDSLMILEGDWKNEAENGVLPFLTSSHIWNHLDKIDGVVEAGAINYVDVWNIPGDVDALTRVELVNNTTPVSEASIVEKYRKIRIGQRRTNNVNDFDYYYDPLGTLDTTASSDYRLDTPALNNNWATIASKIVTGGITVRNNEGRFRTLARIYDPKASGDPTLETRITYFVGTAGTNEKTLDSVLANVRGQWTIVNLTPTKAVIQEAKRSTIPLGQIGYKIEMKRQTGSDIGRLDYVLNMPTDGGYLEATVEPSLTPGNMLIVDNTSSINISGSSRLSGRWITICNTGELVISDIKEFLGNVFFAADGGVYRLKDGAVSKVLTISAPTQGYSKLEIYKGALYWAGIRNTGGGNGPTELYRTANGINWSLVGTIDAGPLNTGGIKGLTSFMDKLFIMEDNLSSQARIYIYDGTTITLNYDYILSFPEIPSNFAIVGNNLYTVISGRIHKYIPSTNSWIVVYNTGFTVSFIINFNKELYFSQSGGFVWKFDGSTITRTSIITDIFLTSFLAMENYNGNLYGGGYSASGDSLVFSGDGVTWSVAVLDTKRVNSIKNINGVLYVGDFSVGGVGAKIYMYADVDNTYAISDYNGGPFTSPPKKRHKWIFNYDRDDYINNIDDKALVGFGYVPRYISLINYYPQ